MMIIIWDNGEDYSNHEVWFIEVQPEDLNGATKILLSELEGYYGGSRIIAVVEALEWHSSKDLSTLDQWIENHAIALTDLTVNGDGYGSRAPSLRSWPLRYRQQLGAALIRVVSGPYTHWHPSYLEDAKKIAEDLEK